MSSPQAKTTGAILVLLVVATFAAFSPVRDNGFVGFDDPRYITHNERVTAGLTADGVTWAFTTTHAYNWHPLTWISHMTDVELFGLDAGSHHLVSVGLHACNAVLLFGLLRTTTAALWPSALVAFLFALHPLRVESVAWASERKDVLGAMLWLVTMAFYAAYARRPSAGRYALVVAAFAGGLLAKPMLVTLPFVLLLVDFWPLGRLRPGRRAPAEATAAAPASGSSSRSVADAAPRDRGVPVSRLLAEKAPLLLLSVAASAMTLRAQQGILQTVESFPLESRLANAALSCVRYLGKMAWPSDLAVFYPYRERAFSSLEVWAAVAALAALTAIAVAFRHRGYPIVGWLWFLGALVPVLGLVQAGIQSMADRYTYLPGIGVLVAVVWGAAELLRRSGLTTRASGRAATAAAAVAALALLATLTWRQTLTWRDDAALFAHAARVTTDSYWASYNLGLTLLNAGLAGEAVAHFEEAVRLEPSSPEALTNLGIALEATPRAEESLLAFRRAVEIAPDDRAAARHLVRALITNGRSEEADVALEDALRRWPDDPELRYSRGLARILSDRPGEAIDSLSRAVELDPGYAAAHNALGIALARTGDPARAIAHFERAVELEPGYQEARDNLTMLLGARRPSAE